MSHYRLGIIIGLVVAVGIISAVPKDGRRETRENVLTTLMQQLESRINVLVDSIKNDTTIPKTMVSMTVTANGNGTEPIMVTYSATNTAGSLKNEPSKVKSHEAVT